MNALYQSEKLCKKPLCESDFPIGAGKCQKHCRNTVKIGKVENFCNQKSVVSAKVIRLAEIKRVRERFPELKIISWRRDPRGTFASRIDMGTKPGNAMAEAKRDCKYAKDNKYIAGVDKHVLEVKYEDLVLNGEITLEKILKFSELEADRELTDFFTPEKQKNKEAEAEGVNQENQGKGSEQRTKDAYENKSFRMSLKRSDPRETAFRWRNKLEFSVIQQIQVSCGEENLIALGYPYFKTEFQFNVWKQRILE